MVFPRDKEWIEAYNEKASQEHQPWSETRYRSMGLEELQVDLIQRHMPWVNKIWIILAQPSQAQPWMMRQGVQIVFHHEFIPREYCPAFSAYTIEMFLHHIKGLAEHFIYFNDDMFPVTTVKPSDFFIGTTGYNAMHVYHPHIIEFSGATRNSFWQVCYNNWLMADRHFHFNSVRAFLGYGHGPNPMSKSIIKRAFDENKKQILGSITAFRKSQNLNQYLWCHYCFLGRYDDGQPTGYAEDYDKTVYLSTALSPELLRMMLTLSDQNGNALFVCYNDTDFGQHTDEKTQIISKFLLNTI